MADLNGVPDPVNPNLNLTPDEKRLFGQLFHAADSDSVGVVTGDVAVKFFEKSRLEPRVLGEIWQIADTENRGFLTPAGFGVVLRLIGHVQAGREPSAELATRPGPLPRFDGFGPLPHPPVSALQPQSSGGPIRVPPLTPDKSAEFAALFEKSGAQNGLLAGDQAKQIFERARLPNDVLGRIWNLADTEQRGALGPTDFVIAMHLLASYKSGALRAIPAILPPGLYEAAARRGPPLRPQASGAASRPFPGPPPPASAFTPQGTGNDWLIGPRDKAQFDGVFAGLDKSNRGFITGDEAVSFFGNSKLPEELLAQIWDLADINSEGRLNRDEFAVAMYLIRQQRTTQPAPAPLPATLPPNLIPPSHRQPGRPAVPSVAAAAAAVERPSFTPPPVKSATEDLFGLDDFTPSSAKPPAVGTGTGAATTPAGADKISSAKSMSSTEVSPSSTFKPFVPSSSFGQTIMTAQATGGSSASGATATRAAVPAKANASDDLLGDNDPDVSRKLTAETSELANLSNQVGNLSTQMQDVRAKRASTEQELSAAAAQKREFEARLAQLRSVYEHEVGEVKRLNERLADSRNETRRLQQEMAMLEGTHADLQSQHRQTAEALAADQGENAKLKERMRVVNAETAQLRTQLDKLKSDARQQKGLVAINKKQLATNEAERERLQTEIKDAAQAVQAAEAAAREAEAKPSSTSREPSRAMSSAELSQSPAATASPAPSTSTNPFFRRNTASESGPASAPFTPPLASAPSLETQTSFDRVFGPSMASTVNQSPATMEPAEPNPLAASASTKRSMIGVEGATPTSSPAPSSRFESPRPADPPPPPESRQVTSTHLPFRDDAQRANSVTSSVNVATPESRVGGSPSAAAATPGHTFVSEVETPRQAREVTDDREGGVGSREASAFPPTTFDAVPGAFPGPETGAVSIGNSTGDDPFASTSTPVRGATGSKEDFDAAFAGLDPSEGADAANKSASDGFGNLSNASKKNATAEFPPIEEFGNDDDDSDTADEQGFDDNFTSPSPKRAADADGTAIGGKQEQVGPEAPRRDTFGARSISAGTAAAAAGLPPPASAEVSPPTYEQTNASGAGREESSAFPAEFTGLLPARQDPLAAGERVETPAAAPLAKGSDMPIGKSVTDSGSMAPAAASHTGSQPSGDVAAAPAANQAVVDEFDQDFEDLAEAKDVEDRGEEEFGTPRHPEAADEFNAVFDSPAPSKTNTMVSQPTSLGNSTYVTDGFHDFEQKVGSASQMTNGSKPSQDASMASSHDWDAVFAGLESTNGTKSIAAGSGQIGPSSQATAAASTGKPALARTLTEGTEHDDPILKRLTGMGYPRAVALSALERYDYNIDKAADFLVQNNTPK